MKSPAEVHAHATTADSFATLDKALGVALRPEDASIGLGAWYASVATTPIAKLSVADLAKAVRQKVHAPVTLRAALDLLEKDPWAGHLYPTELVQALDDVAGTVWSSDEPLRTRAKKVLRRLLDEAPPKDSVVDETLAEAKQTARAVLARIEAAAHKRLSLEVVAGPHKGRRVVQGSEPEVLIGSGPRCVLYLPELEKEHASVRQRGDAIELVAIGGEVETAGKVITVAALRPGDRFTVGATTIQLGVEA